MIRAADITAAIDWQEGLLLAPHHFQQLDRRAGELAAYLGGIGDPTHYGIARLVVEDDKLPGGLFSVVELEAVMPDGLVVTHTKDMGELSIKLSPEDAGGENTGRGEPAHDEGNGESDARESEPDLLTVWLAVRRASDTAPEEGRGRYRSAPAREVDDESGGPERISIPTKRPCPELFAGRHPGPAFTTMPLARLECADGPFRKTEYIPPLLWMARTHELSMMCASLVGTCREKALQLSSRVEAMADSGSAQLEARMRIAALIRPLPRIEALLSLPAVRPLPLFLGVCDLVGELVGLDSMGLAEAPPTYRHEDLHQCFTACKDAVSGAMQRCMDTEYVERRFVWKDESFILSSGWLGSEPGGVLYIGVMENVALGKLGTHGWFESCRIGSCSLMEGMVSRRDIGADRRLAGDDSRLALPARVSLFEVQLDADYILPGEPLCIQNDAYPLEERPTAIVLYARTGQGEGAHV